MSSNHNSPKPHKHHRSRDKQRVDPEISQALVNKYQIKQILKILGEMEYGIQLVKEEFKIGMHRSVASIIKKIDTIMSGSLKRAHGGLEEAEGEMEEKIIQKLLTSVNISQGRQVNKIIKTEQTAINSPENQSDILQKNSVYEKKISLMEAQIKGLTDDLRRKVNLDKRKIKFAKDQLQKYESRLNNYGQVGMAKRTASDFLTTEEQAPKKSVHEVTVIGTQLNQLDLDLSNQYEQLPIFFQYLVPKTHLNLINLIEYYDRFEIKKERPSDSYERAYFWVFKANFSDQEIMNCEVCYQPVAKRFRHVQNVHQDLLHNIKPSQINMKGYLQSQLLRDGICPVGCGYKTNENDIRKHLITYHSKMQLQVWQINRDYLMYQEEMMSREEFIKTIQANEFNVFDSSRGCVRREYQNQQPIEANQRNGQMNTQALPNTNQIINNSVTDETKRERLQDRMDQYGDVDNLEQPIKSEIKDEIEDKKKQRPQTELNEDLKKEQNDIIQQLARGQDEQSSLNLFNNDQPRANTQVTTSIRKEDDKQFSSSNISDDDLEQDKMEDPERDGIK